MIRSLSLLLLSWKVISCDVPAICVNGVEFIVADVMWIPLVLGKLAFVDRGTVLNLYFVNYSHGEFFGLSNINHSSCVVVIAIDVVSK